MILAPATPDDLAGIVHLMNRAYRGAGESASWNIETGYITGDRVKLDDLADELAAGLPLLVWCDEDGALLGCFSLEYPDPATGYLGMLTVRPDRQDRQLGRALLAEAERRARDAGAGRMRMSVLWVRETLIAWYVRRGYTLTGETKPFPYGDERWGRPLRGDLHFVLLEKPL